MQLQYVITPELKAMGIKASVVAEITGLHIAPQHEELEQLKHQATAALLTLSEAELATNPILEGYRGLVRGLGRSLKRFPAAAENLICQIKRVRQFPTINTAVDSYNLVVVKRLLALGVHDLAKLGTTITFRLSEGGEPFLPVGSNTVKTTQRGDFVYADEQHVLAWLDSKDSDDVKVSLATTALTLIIQGTARTDRAYTWATAEEACHLITRFCGGQYEITAVD